MANEHVLVHLPRERKEPEGSEVPRTLELIKRATMGRQVLDSKSTHDIGAEHVEEAEDEEDWQASAIQKGHHQGDADDGCASFNHELHALAQLVELAKHVSEATRNRESRDVRESGIGAGESESAGKCVECSRGGNKLGANHLVLGHGATRSKLSRERADKPRPDECAGVRRNDLD